MNEPVADEPGGLQPVRSHAPRLNPGRVLIKEVNWLGDLVMSLPALRAIRATFASARLSVLVLSQLAGFFDGIPWIDEVIPYHPAAGLSAVVGRHLRIIREIRRRRFDLAIVLPNSFQSALWVTMAGIPRRAGYAADGRGFMLTDRAVYPPDPNLHLSDSWLTMLRNTLGVIAPDDVADHEFEPSPGNLARMRMWLAERRLSPDARLVAIAPAAAYGPAKEWPLVRYVALVDLLDERYGAECVLVGTAPERNKCEQVAATSRANAIVAAGELNIGELAALFALCDGFVGNDSGAMHLAAAVGIPTIGIFGSTDPVRTGPRGSRTRVVRHPPPCSPCLERTCRFDHYDCLRAITPAEVSGELERLGLFDAGKNRSF
jgi:heptosyltransferase-2